MDVREFLDKIADLFGRKNWADFSFEEDQKLRDLFDDIDTSACSRCLEENINQYTEIDVEDARGEGFDEGYEEGKRDTERESYSEGYEDALEDYKAGKLEHPNDCHGCADCTYFGHNANLGWTYCMIQNKHFSEHCEYCRDFEKQPGYTITTATTIVK